MTRLRALGLALLVLSVTVASLELGELAGVPGVHGVVSTAEAVVGRPLTPVSVAGVTRRTVRRCAVGVVC